MAFILDQDVMRQTLNVTEDESDLKHNTKCFKLFPYTTNKNKESIVERFDAVVGDYLRVLLSQNAVTLDLHELKKTIQKELNIADEDLSVFDDVINSIFFCEGMLSPMNLRMYSYIGRNDIAEKHMSHYLASVLSPYPQISKVIQDALDRENLNDSVLEGILLRALPLMSKRTEEPDSYYSVVRVTHEVFAKDLRFVLENTSRTKEYLVELLEFYYFFYTVQTCLQLSRFLDGCRDRVVPLYFSLDWEKTNRGRLCFTQGWKVLDPAIETIFIHALTLEILNQRKGLERYDYIALANEIANDPNADVLIATQIRPLAQLYRKVKQTGDPSRQDAAPYEGTRTEHEVRLLFQDIQKEITKIGGVSGRYRDKFREFCIKRFLKNRYSSGYMLNITERTLIFLTKLCIGSNESLRLIEIFKEMEKRGVFLDAPSKEAVMRYYERLNLIEKKSDSGDAQYVKRIL